LTFSSRLKFEAGDEPRQVDEAKGLTPSAKVGAVAPLRFSTDDFPAGERVAILRDVLRQRSIAIDIEPLPGRAFRVEASLRALPGLDVLSAFSLAARARRTLQHTADGKDCFCLVIVSSGACVVSRGDTRLVLEHGNATLLSAAEPMSITSPAMSHSLTVSVPLSALVPRVADAKNAVMRPIPRGTEALNLLTAYLGFLNHEIASAPSDLWRHAVNHVYDLVALAIGATDRVIDVAQDRGLPAARLRAIKADVVDNVGHTDLSIDGVAARHGISPRHVRRLFEAGGTTFSEFVLEQRLTHAYRLLTDPSVCDRPISSIAFDCGFADLSYFNRTFRRTFGAPPTDVRALIRRQGD
jgi:AraC-like DNA-binding protein